MKNLNFCFGNWLVIGFFTGADSSLEVEIALLINEASSYIQFNSHFFKEGKSEKGKVGLYKLPIAQMNPLEPTLNSIYEKTLDYIANKFQNSRHQKLRKHHVSEIAEALFDSLKREKLFNEGLRENADIQISTKDAGRQDLAELANNVQQKLQVERYFDPTNIEDARERIITSIVRRQGQSQFRQRLLKVYNNRCAITGCDAEPALEAAHIISYKGTDTQHPSNGLLLRADIHTLFDLHLLSVDPKTKTVLIASSLANTCYSELAGKQLSPPLDEDLQPNIEALEQHYKRFISANG